MKIFFKNFLSKLKIKNKKNHLTNSEEIIANQILIKEQLEEINEYILKTLPQVIEAEIIRNKNKICSEIITANSIFNLHQKSFSRYKNLYREKNVVLIATGPTLNYYENIYDAIHVGVNKSFKFDKINLDYIFCTDYSQLKQYQDLMYEFLIKNSNVQAFYGKHLTIPIRDTCQIPESIILKHGANAFFTKSDNNINFFDEELTLDISCHVLKSFCSTVFQALQFILYTNPQKIYLVGCDTNSSGYFDFSKQTLNEENLKGCIDGMLVGWNNFKIFVNKYYPETEIISINPVGLKGMFKDEYTESFLNK